MAHENESAGAARDFGGKIQDAVGGLTGDFSTQAKEKWNEVSGQAQRSLGEASDELRSNVKGSPLIALAIVGGLCFVLGFLSRR